MFSRFIEMEKHKNNAWQLQKRLHEVSAAINDRLRQHYNEPQLQQLARYIHYQSVFCVIICIL